MHLYDLAEEAVALEALCVMDEGDWTDEHEALARELAGKLVSKADAFGGYLKTLDARSKAIHEEEKRLSARGDAIDNHVTRLKTYAMIALQHMGKTSVEGDLFTLRVQQNPPSVSLSVTPEQIPEAYLRVIPERKEPDKAKLLQALKSGAVIEGVELTRTSSLRVR